MNRDELLKVIKNARHANVLNLSGSQLNELPPEIGELTHLTRLNLKHNKLTHLPKEIGKLTNLRELWLDDNLLQELPREIGALKKLKWLSVSNNQLKTLPETLQELEQLDILELRNNPGLPLPMEDVALKPSEIVRYVLSQHEKQFINEVKLMVLGNSGSGKTSLIRRLIERNFEPTEKSTKTIATQRWPLQIGHKNIQLNVWDFGANETFFNIHRLFLTPNTIYLLVWDATVENHRAELRDWLQLISFLSDGAPIIVVFTKTDLPVKEINRQVLQQQFPAIQQFITVSAATGTGFSELRESLKNVVLTLPNTQTHWQPGWLNVKTRLEISREPFITLETYYHLCEREGIDRYSAEALLCWLRDLGTVTAYPNDLRIGHYIIKEPRWLTEALVGMLSQPTASQQPGIVAGGSFDKLFDGERYAAAHRPFFIDLMKRFELGYDVDDGSDRLFLIPALLPENSPEKEADTAGITVRYRYKFLPKEIIAKTAAKAFPFLMPNSLWQNGFALHDSKNRAVVKMNTIENYIDVAVSGSTITLRDFTAQVCGYFENLHALYPKIQVQKCVVLPEHPEICIDYNNLVKLAEKGEVTVYIDGLSEPVAINALLNGFDVSRQQMKLKARQLQEALHRINQQIEACWREYAKESHPQKLAEIEHRISQLEQQRDEILNELSTSANTIESLV